MFSLGDNVRVLPPFDAAYTEVYVLVAVHADGATYTLSNGGDFHQDYLEAV